LAGLYFSIILVEIAAFIYFAILLYLLMKKQIPPGYFSYLILAYVLSAFVSMISGGDSIKELPRLFPHLMILSYFPITYLIGNQKSFKTSQWLHWIMIFATLSAIVGVIYHCMGKERTTSTYGGYYTLANMMAWSIPFSIALFLERKDWKSVIYGIAILLQLLALWWTFTRSAMLALVGAIGIWFLSQIFQLTSGKRDLTKNQLIRWSFVMSLPVLLILLVLTSSDARMNPFTSSENGEQETVDLTSGRQSIFEDAIRIIKQDLTDKKYSRLIFGYGQHSRFRLVNNEFTSWESDYLQILMNQGILGLLILLLMYLYFIKVIWLNLLDRSILLNGISIAGFTIFFMSFFTLKLTGWHSGAMFIITMAFLENHKLNEPLS
jgi:O-antigen ligase